MVFSFESDKFEAAIEHYTKALGHVPDNPKILSNRAACYHKLEMPELCIQVLPVVLSWI